MGSMDNDAFKMYLQNIEEYVMDEDKIVTYKWLSKNLDIHVNTSKQLLYSFAAEQKNKVHSTYVVAGLLKDNEGIGVKIVREEDVAKVKEEFQLVTSEHVYSVQKTNKLKDLNVLYAVDVVKSSEPEDIKNVGSIKCNFPVLRPRDEVEGLKQKTRAAAVVNDDKRWPAAKKAATNPKDTKPTEASSNGQEAGKDESKGENGTKKNEPKKAGIAAMFAAQNNKTKAQDKPENKNKASDSKSSKSGGKGIAMFFNRADKPATIFASKTENGLSSKSDSKESAEDKKATPEKKKNESSPSSTKKEKHVEDNSTKGESTPPTKKESTPKGAKQPKAKPKEEKKGRGRKKKPTDDLPAKKRKRIVVMSDSEDSDDGIFGKDDDEEEEAVPYSPPPPQPQQPESDEDIVPPTPEASLKKGRKRVRKLKTKTFMDEEGFLLTSKEYVFESCTDSEKEEEEKENKTKDSPEQQKDSGEKKKESESESSPMEPPAKKQNRRKKDSAEKQKETGSSPKEPLAKKQKGTKSSPKKTAAKKKSVSPQKNKQASIMNFFKKK